MYHGVTDQFAHSLSNLMHGTSYNFKFFFFAFIAVYKICRDNVSHPLYIPALVLSIIIYLYLLKRVLLSLLFTPFFGTSDSEGALCWSIKG